MKQLLQITLKIYILIGIFLNVYAQEAVPASGGDASGSGGSASYSIGQVVYTTHTTTAGSVAQGVQQAFEISIVLSIEENQFDISISAFPNPTKNKLILKIKDINNDSLSYQLYDSYGRLLKHKKIINQTTTIATENLANAIYFLKVSTRNSILKIFKIIKN